MLVGAIANSVQAHRSGHSSGVPAHRVESYTGRNNLALKPVAKKKQAGLIGGLKSAFSKFGAWVKGLFTSATSTKPKAGSFTAKFDRLNTKLEALNTELKSVDKLDIRTRFDSIHSRLVTLETQVDFHEATKAHEELPKAVPVPPPGYTDVPIATVVQPSAPPSPSSSSYSVAQTHHDVSRASYVVSSSVAPKTREIVNDMKRVAGVVDARKLVSESPRGRQEEKLRARIAADPSLAKRFEGESVLSKDERMAIKTIREMTKKTLEISRQVSDVADVVFDVNRDMHLKQFESRLNILKADPTKPTRSDYETIQADIKTLANEIETIRNWVSSYQEVLAEMQRLYAEFGPYLAAEKEAVQFEIDNLMRKQQQFYNQLSHAELSLQGTGHAMAIPV